MDKGMKAKVDEFLKNRPQRELNMDEMEKVVGGGTTVPPDYKEFGMTEMEAGQLLQMIYDQFGPDVAISFANEFWVVTPDWHDTMMLDPGPTAAYHAVGIVWQKGYDQSQGGNGY